MQDVLDGISKQGNNRLNGRFEIFETNRACVRDAYKSKSHAYYQSFVHDSTHVQEAILWLRLLSMYKLNFNCVTTKFSTLLYNMLGPRGGSKSLYIFTTLNLLLNLYSIYSGGCAKSDIIHQIKFVATCYELQISDSNQMKLLN